MRKFMRDEKHICKKIVSITLATLMATTNLTGLAAYAAVDTAASTPVTTSTSTAKVYGINYTFTQVSQSDPVNGHAHFVAKEDTIEENGTAYFKVMRAAGTNLTVKASNGKVEPVATSEDGFTITYKLSGVTADTTVNIRESWQTNYFRITMTINSGARTGGSKWDGRFVVKGYYANGVLRKGMDVNGTIDNRYSFSSWVALYNSHDDVGRARPKAQTNFWEGVDTYFNTAKIANNTAEFNYIANKIAQSDGESWHHVVTKISISGEPVAVPTKLGESKTTVLANGEKKGTVVTVGYWGYETTIDNGAKIPVYRISFSNIHTHLSTVVRYERTTQGFLSGVKVQGVNAQILNKPDGGSNTWSVFENNSVFLAKNKATNSDGSYFQIRWTEKPGYYNSNLIVVDGSDKTFAFNSANMTKSNGYYVASLKGANIASDPVSTASFSATPIQYSVKYDINGGSYAGATPTDNGVYNVNNNNTIVVDRETPTRPGYKFLGYSIKNDTIGTKFLPGSIVDLNKTSAVNLLSLGGTSTGQAEIVLEAQWQQISTKVDVTYSNNDNAKGTLPAADKAWHGFSYSLPGTEYTMTKEPIVVDKEKASEQDNGAGTTTASTVVTFNNFQHIGWKNVTTGEVYTFGQKITMPESGLALQPAFKVVESQANVKSSLSADSFTISSEVAANFAGKNLSVSDDLGRQLIELADASAKTSTVESSEMVESSIATIKHDIKEAAGNYNLTFTSAEGVVRTVTVTVTAPTVYTNVNFVSDGAKGTVPSSERVVVGKTYTLPAIESAMNKANVVISKEKISEQDNGAGTNTASYLVTYKTYEHYGWEDITTGTVYGFGQKVTMPESGLNLKPAFRIAQVQTNVYASISAKAFTISSAVAAKFAGNTVTSSDDLGKQLISLANASAKASSIESSVMQLSNINGISHNIRALSGSYTVTFTSAEGISKTVAVKVDNGAAAKEEVVTPSDKTDATIDTSSSSSTDSSVDTDKIADGSKTETATKVNDATVERLFGPNRYDTAIAIAEQVLEVSQKAEHKSIIVANGNSFQEALVGSYLSKSLSASEGQYAPILLVSDNEAIQTKVADYIKQNLKEGGKVYLLGGVSLIPSSFSRLLKGLDVERIAGSNSYANNLEILKAANVPAGSEIIIASGDSYADNLSASASGRPILLVKSSGLTAEQIEYLNSISPSRIIIMGGTGAVSAQVASQLNKNFAGTEIKRLAGANRYETSRLAALQFFGDGSSSMNASSVTLAYGLNFADGLGGGIIAMASGGPLVLVASTASATTASQWIGASGAAISTINVLGGSSLITDEMVKIIAGN